MEMVSTKLEFYPPISKMGCDYSSIDGDYITKREISKINAENSLRKQWLTLDSTVILGCSPTNKHGAGCKAKWVFDISKIMKKTLVSAQLKIVTFRTTGGIHINPDFISLDKAYKQGRLFINGKKVDNIDLVKMMPSGLDYGFNRLDSYPILGILNEMKKSGEHIISLELDVDENVYWDIDEIRIEDIVYQSKDLCNWEWMLAGAIIGTAIQMLISAIIS